MAVRWLRADRLTLVAAAAILLVASAWVLLAAVAAAHAPSSSTEAALVSQGARVERGAATPLAATLGEKPTTLALVDPPRLLGDQTTDLQRYVEGGGELIVVSPDPGQALWPALREKLTTYEGYVFAYDGGPGRFTTTPDASGKSVAFTMSGAQAINLSDDTGWSPLIIADEWNFRDTNGDRILEAGEP